MALIRDRSRRTALLKMLVFGLFLIGLQAYLVAGSGAAQFFIGFSLKKLLIQVPAGIVAVWIASRIFEFDFGTVGRIAQKIASITVLAEGVACWIPIPFFSIVADLTVMLLGFFILFELSRADRVLEFRRALRSALSPGELHQSAPFLRLATLARPRQL
jgi:hypothetical protein